MSVKYFIILSIVLFGVAVVSAQPENSVLPGGIIFDGEPSMAVNPTNPNNIVIAWMSEVLTDLQIGIRTSMSTDGGHTWSASSILPHHGAAWHSADVSIVFASNGTAYLSFIDHRESPDSGGVYLTHSSNNGVGWSAPIEAVDLWDVPEKAAIDRPWIAIDNSGTSSDGTLYLTTKPASWIQPSESSPNEPYFKRSTDHGLTWSSVAPVDGGEYPVGSLISAPMAAPNVTASGAFVAMYPSYELLHPARQILARSYDGGRHFERFVAAEKRSVKIVGDTLSKLGYCLLADPGDSNRLAFISPGDSLGDWDAYAYGSSDAGKTWSIATRINDDPPSNGVLQDLVWGAYASNGDLVAAWRDRRNAGVSGYRQPSDIYVAVSKDNGRTFGKNIRLSSTSAEYASVLDGNGNDFLTCAVVSDSICTAWGDTRSGKLKIYFSKAALADGAASVTEVSSDETELLISPSVVRSSFTLTSPSELGPSISLSLISMNGETLHLLGVSVDRRKLSCSLPEGVVSGVYLVRLTTASQVLTTKLIVVR